MSIIYRLLLYYKSPGKSREIRLFEEKAAGNERFLIFQPGHTQEKGEPLKANVI